VTPNVPSSPTAGEKGGGAQNNQPNKSDAETGGDTGCCGAAHLLDHMVAFDKLLHILFCVIAWGIGTVSGILFARWTLQIIR
jgi:hypothetical protein